MKTSVCIFAREGDAKKMLRKLREKQLGASLEEKTGRLSSGEELPLHIISAERPEHPIALDEVAEADHLHGSIIRCSHCRSARLEIPINDDFSATAKVYHILITALMKKLRLSPASKQQRILCRDCAGIVTLDDYPSLLPIHGDPLIEPIAA